MTVTSSSAAAATCGICESLRLVRPSKVMLCVTAIPNLVGCQIGRICSWTTRLCRPDSANSELETSTNCVLIACHLLLSLVMMAASLSLHVMREFPDLNCSHHHYKIRGSDVRLLYLHGRNSSPPVERADDAQSSGVLTAVLAFDKVFIFRRPRDGPGCM